MSEKPSKGGIYKHYKNQQSYRVIDIVKHSETLEELVLYEALYENDLGRLWVRPLDMFMQKVELQDGSFVPRFELLT